MINYKKLKLQAQSEGNKSFKYDEKLQKELKDQSELVNKLTRITQNHVCDLPDNVCVCDLDLVYRLERAKLSYLQMQWAIYKDHYIQQIFLEKVKTEKIKENYLISKGT